VRQRSVIAVGFLVEVVFFLVLVIVPVIVLDLVLLSSSSSALPISSPTSLPAARSCRGRIRPGVEVDLLDVASRYSISINSASASTDSTRKLSFSSIIFIPLAHHGLEFSGHRSDPLGVQPPRGARPGPI